jgi:G3E family GTPase
MAKVDIFSGFLGAGKTTLIKKLVEEAYKGEKVVLIENEFGEIGIDGGFLKDSGIQINEMNAGCICCSLVGDFSKSLEQVLEQFHPDRILIEPSGVGKLSDIVEAVEGLNDPDLQLNGFTTVVDAKKAKVYMKNFGEFYNNQVEHASAIILSHTKDMAEDKLKAVVELMRAHNDHATIITTDWDQLEGKQILKAMENRDTLEQAIELLEKEHAEHHHDHDDDECDDPECSCHHHHHDDDDDDEHEHEHHHHHHDADDVFMSWGMETPLKYTKEEIEGMLAVLEDDEKYGIVLRTKGVVPTPDGAWIEFDYVPGEADVRNGSADVTGKFCVIGSELKEDNLQKLFRKL